MSELTYQLLWFHNPVGDDHVERLKFPEDYTHVANLKAESLHEIYLNTDEYDWSLGNSKAELLIDDPRGMVPGDVIVDPQGQAHRFEGYGGHFQRIDGPEHPEAKGSDREAFSRIMREDPKSVDRPEPDKDRGRER